VPPQTAIKDGGFMPEKAARGGAVSLTKGATMRRLIVIFLSVIAAGGGAGAATADHDDATPVPGPPTLGADVQCQHPQADRVTCFYPAHGG
jgi:hypothetical protein